ncbi:MAG: hypothetical protein AB7V46_03435 [Thermomicrobiales bacterium]
MTIRAVKIRGTFRGPTGHDRHVRAFSRELVRAGVAVQLIDMPEWSARRLAPDQLDPWFETLDRDVGASVFLQFCMPHQLRPRQKSRTVNFTMFEADRVPDFWVRAAEKSLLTILPERSSYAAWVSSGVDARRLRICQLGVSPEDFGSQVDPLPLAMRTGEDVSSRSTRFLNLSEVVPRKNQPGLLKAWLMATTAKDDAVLVLKIGGESRSDIERVQSLFARIEAESGKSFAEAAPVVILNRLLGDDEMPRLYAASTHYISLSFGEGWDLPLMEAAASGLRLIAPDHTAYQTYLNPAIATLLPVRKRPAVTDGDFRIFFGGAEWWEPDLDAATLAIRSAIDGREQTVASPRDFILGHYTWAHATQRLIEILSEAEEMPIRPG